MDAAVPMLDAELRSRTVEQLAQLVLLAQVHRHFAAGWITRPTFDRRWGGSWLGSAAGPVSGARFTARE